MRSVTRRLSFAIPMYLATASVANSVNPDPQPPAPVTSTWPTQLEMRVPFEPTTFSSGGRTHLTYELLLTNFAQHPVTLRRVEVLEADAADPQPIAAFEGAQLDALLQPIGAPEAASLIGAPTAADQASNPDQLATGRAVVVFLWVALGDGAHVPSKLRHRVLTADSVAEGAIIGTHHTELLVLAPPVQGADWLASDGPSNDRENHHRRGILIYDGRAQISRRYAIDWGQSKGGAPFSGDALDKRSYYAYGKDVVAVADGVVVTATDALPDNVPGHGERFHPAVPITIQTVAGNAVTLDLGSGQFAHYLHLKPGSLRVKAGDRVRRGQVLAQIGNSGDSRGPHLHFQVSTSSNPLAGEGVPYLIDHFRMKSTDNTWQVRTNELPLGEMLINFGS